MEKIYIITRFNIAVNYGPSKQATVVPNYKPWLDDMYLSKRFNIFEKYTFPSLIRQTDVDFEWIVLFHQDTPDEYKKRITEYQSQMNNFKPWFMNDEDSYRAIELVGEYLESIRTGQKQEIISARIDNDDMINKNFIKMVREELSASNKETYLSFKDGLSYNIMTGYCSAYEYVGNHFLAMKSGSNITYILQAGVHDQVMKQEDDSVKKVVSTKMPMWVELISDTNCANVIKWSGLSNMFLPYDTSKEYPELEKLWNNKVSYVIKSIMTPLKYYKNMLRSIIKYKSEWRKG